MVFYQAMPDRQLFDNYSCSIPSKKGGIKISLLFINLLKIYPGQHLINYLLDMKFC